MSLEAALDNRPPDELSGATVPTVPHASVEWVMWLTG